MSKNKKTIISVILIIVVAILVIAGIVFVKVICPIKHYNQICPIKIYQQNQNQVSLSTNKTEYQTNENISFTVSNNSTKNILISACPQGEGFVEIEEKIAEKWELMFVNLCLTECIGPYTLKPSEKHVYSQQEFFTCMDTSIPSAPGNYRVKFGYATNLPYRGNTNWIYSNSFEIKYCPEGTVFQSEGCNNTKPCCCPVNAKCD